MLLVTTVPRALEVRNKLLGFELGDVLLVFLYLAGSNLLFGTTRLKYGLVWGGTIALGLLLHFTKRNKPPQFIQHYAQFLNLKPIFYAGKPDTIYTPYQPWQNR